MKADSLILTSDLDLRRVTVARRFVASSLAGPVGNIALTHSVNPLPTHEKAENENSDGTYFTF
jgi:hypothetical protein